MLTRSDNLPTLASAPMPGSGALPGSGGSPDGGGLPDGGSVIIHFECRAIAARPGDSVAAALLAAGVSVTRNTPVSGAARGPYCMMGACFDCLAVVDGRPNVQTCMTQVRGGMRIERQDGARGLAIAAVDVSTLSPPSWLEPTPQPPPSLDPSPQPPPSRGGGE